jgi:hypothetical protein
LIDQWENRHRDEAKAKDAVQEQASNDELDAIKAFRVCHTNRKNGMSDTAKEALVSHCTCLFHNFFDTTLLFTVILVIVSSQWKLCGQNLLLTGHHH